VNQRVRPKFLIAVLAAGAFVASLTQTLILPLLPSIPERLGISADEASWLVTVTVIVGTVSNPLLGRLGDQFGRRRLLLVSLGAFTIGSVVVAGFSDPVLLLIGRGVQGIATAAIPLGISIAATTLRGTSRARAIALISATLGIGGAIGLPIAGVLAEALGFHGTFWLTAGVGVLTIVAVAFVVPPSPRQTEPASVDIVGSLLLAAAITSSLIVLAELAAGMNATMALSLTVVAVGSLAAFLTVELRAKHPLIDLRVAIRRPVILANIAGFGIGFVFFTNTLSLITEAQLQPPAGLGLGLTAAGLSLLPGGLAMATAAPLSASITRRWGSRITLIIGSLMVVAALVFRFLANTELWQLVVTAVIVFTGVGFAYAAMATVVVDASPSTQAGSASGLNALTRSLGTAVASTTFGALLGATGRNTETILFITAALSVVAIVASFAMPERSRDSRS